MFSRTHLSRCFIAAFALSAASLYAQSDLGTIQGVVKDPSASVVPGAAVTVRNQGDGLERKTRTNDGGFYTVTNIPSGIYTITVEAKGFKKFESLGNKLDSSANLAVDATLTVGAATETVEVTASTQTLQTEDATVEKLITREQIDSLELNGRNPVGLASLVPGAHGGNLAGLNFNFSQGPGNFNGSRNQENLITYDGAPATRTRANGTSIGAADVDSTSEVQILTAAYSAEYGRTSGAQIRIVTKPGGKDFHGAIYEYIRNDAFNANTWTRNRTAGQGFAAPIRYNQYGFNLGGPGYIPKVWNTGKNKFFWYWGTEWVNYTFTDSATWTVPTALMRQGNFSELLATGPANILGKVVTIKDPTSGIAYPGNIIPASQLSPNGTGILKAYPVPNLAVGNFIGTSNYYITAIHPQDQRKETANGDYNISDKQRIALRRNSYQFDEYQPLDGTPTETPKYFHRPNQTNSVDYVNTISPTLINESLATFSLDYVAIPVDAAHFFDRTTAGINYPYIFPTGKLIQNRIPTANITGLTGLTGNPYPSHSAGPIWTLSDSLTWVKGNHTFKFGFYYEHSGENDNDEINVSACPTCTNNQNGQFTFTDTRNNNGAPNTGNAIANTALGLFDSYSELGQRAYTPFRGSSYEPFVQDTWKVSPKLTVNWGFRYTVISPYHAIWGNMAAFDPALYDPSQAEKIDPKTGTIIPGSGDRYNGLVIPGSAWPANARGRFPEAFNPTYDYLFRGGKYPSQYANTQWNLIQPRLGIAYNLNKKTVIRTGGGRFVTRNGVSDSIFLGGNPPFQPTANVTYGLADNPGGTSTNLLPLTVTTEARDLKNPEAWNWNFTVEREFYLNSILSVAYVGRRGIHLQQESDINQPTIQTVLNNPGVNLDALRPFKGYNSIRMTNDVALSRYNSLQISWNRRLTKGLLFGAAYTWAKSQDNGSAYRDNIPDTYFAGNLWGPSDFDNRHTFIMNYLYNLPFFKGNTHLVGRALGGWQVSGIVQWQTGTPTSVGQGTDYAGVGLDGSLSGTNEFWVHSTTAIVYNKNIVSDFNNTGADTHYWFVPTDSSGNPIFTKPASGTFNLQNGVRNIIYNPGFNNTNVGLFKNIPLAAEGRVGVQFRAEAFNALNHPNWGGVNNNPTSTSFGKITGKSGDVRNLQLSLRAYF